MDDLITLVEDGWQELTATWETFPPTTQDILTLGAIILTVWLLRVILIRIFIYQLHRLTRRFAAKWDDVLLEHVETPLRYFSIALILYAFLGAVDMNDRPAEFIERIAQMLIIISAGILAFHILSAVTEERTWVERLLGTIVQDEFLPFIRTGVRVVVVALAGMLIVEVWGYDINGLVAGLGIGGLAIAFAAQDTISNLFGFSTIVGDQPFVVGEYIKTPHVEGKVEKVGLRSTRIRQLDQAVVTVPNSLLSNAPILNWSRLGKRRVDFTLGLTYHTTSGQIRAFLKDLRTLLQEWNTVEPDTVVVYFINFGSSSLDILVRCYILKADWGEFTAEKELIQLAIMELVEQHGLSIAFPSQSLYVERFPSADDPQTRPYFPPTTDRSTRYVPLAPDGDVEEEGKS